MPRSRSAASAIERLTDDDGRRQADDSIPFYGPHQAGIATPAQDRLHFAAFDLVTDSVADVARPAADVDRRPPRG